jgi:hypothetical protein
MSSVRRHFTRRGAVALTGILAFALLTLATLPASANLPGSTFEGNDGNLVVTTPGNTDWENAPHFVKQLDLASGQSDDSFGQGAKENISCPTEVTGSIPPQKSDLTRFYVGSETVNGHFFLYLAWERSNVLGNANMDFEFNQSTTACSNEPALSAVPIRTAGDMLVTYDFVNGGGNPVIGIRRWIGSSESGQWGAKDKLGNNAAEAKVNDTTVTDPIAPGPNDIPALEFGEAAIDLTAAGVVPEGECNPFASTYLKSRSSASFTSELKDFIRPTNAGLNNCGAIKISKTAKNASLGSGPHPLPGATFTVTQGTTTVGGGTTDANGEICLSGLTSGSYTVTETDAPAGYSIDGPASQDVTVSGGGTCDSGFASAPFTDTPLSKITVLFHSKAGAGVTTATINCGSGEETLPDNSTGKVLDDLAPGTYSCTVVVDP